METMQMNVSEWGQKKKKGAILLPYIVYLATFNKVHIFWEGYKILQISTLPMTGTT